MRLVLSMEASKARRIEILAIDGLPEVRRGDDLVRLVVDACARKSLVPEDGDVFVFTQKIVSKAEGRLVSLDGVEPSALARSFARESGRDARLYELALREARRVVRMDRGVLLTETHQGLVCANSGVDASNVEGESVSLLPEDPDSSAAAMRRRLFESTGARVAVVITDTFGRPWREGLTNVAIGLSGMEPFVDYRGQRDGAGRVLASTVIAHADEIAAAAELVMGKLDRVPVALVRGYAFRPGEGSARAIVRDAARDLFR